MQKKILLVALLFFSTPLLGQLPVVQSKWDNGYQEARFHYVLDEIFALAEPLVRAQGGELRFYRDWSDGAVNMWAGKTGNEFWVEIPGGFSRYYLINEDAFILTICHELGHVLGGEPMSHGISFEGQSDYWSTQVCGKLVFDNIGPLPNRSVDLKVTEVCETHRDKQVCERTLSGSLSVTSYFAEILNVPFPQLETPDTSVVRRTLREHPSPQCRLDTLVAGFFSEPRPRCWYQP